MTLKKKEVDGVLKQTPNKKYKYFIGTICHTEEVWGLSKDGGWALAADEGGAVLIPLWPSKEYAQLCASNEWKGFVPEFVEVHDFLNHYIDELQQNEIGISIFYTPNDKGILIEYTQLKQDIQQELSRIE